MKIVVDFDAPEGLWERRECTEEALNQIISRVGRMRASTKKLAGKVYSEDGEAIGSWTVEL